MTRRTDRTRGRKVLERRPRIDNGIVGMPPTGWAEDLVKYLGFAKDRYRPLANEATRGLWGEFYVQK